MIDRTHPCRVRGQTTSGQRWGPPLESLQTDRALSLDQEIVSLAKALLCCRVCVCERERERLVNVCNNFANELCKNLSNKPIKKSIQVPV